MALDSCIYERSTGLSVYLNGRGRRSSPVTAKPFAYTVSDGNAVDSPREFSLQIICTEYYFGGVHYTAEQCANDTVDILLYDVTNKTDKFGSISVNGWHLDCICTGVESVENERGGVYSFVARFYAKSLLWTKQLSSVMVASGESITLEGNALLKVELNSVIPSGSASVNTYFRVGSKMDATFNGVTSANRITVNAKDKEVGGWYGATPFLSLMVNSSKPFSVVPAGTYTVSHNANYAGSATDDAIRITPFLIRGIPPWQ